MSNKLSAALSGLDQNGRCPGVKTPGSVLSSLQDESDMAHGAKPDLPLGDKSDQSIDIGGTESRPAYPYCNSTLATTIGVRVSGCRTLPRW
jgi:hypothetical protein